jgi:hypothetical protein
MQNILGRVQNPALREGLLFGVILGLVQILLSFINIGSLGSYIPIILAFGAYIFAGLRASQQTGKLGTGVFAGLWTGLFSSVISSIPLLLVTFINMDAIIKNIEKTNHTQVSSSQLITSVFYYLFIGIILAVLFGLVGGALGGFMGKNRRQLPPPEEYQDTTVQSPAPTQSE